MSVDRARIPCAPECVLLLYGSAPDKVSLGVLIVKSLRSRLWPIVTSSRVVVDAIVAPFCSHNLVGDGRFPGRGKLADRCLAVFTQLDDCTLHYFDTLPMVIPITRDVPRDVTRFRCEAEAAFCLGVRQSVGVCLRCVDLGMSWCVVNDVMEAIEESALDRRVCSPCGGAYNHHHNEQTLHIYLRTTLCPAYRFAMAKSTLVVIVKVQG